MRRRSLESKYMEPVTRFANAIFYTPTHSCHYAEVPISIGASASGVRSHPQN
jgi:hypothetical protein